MRIPHTYSWYCHDHNRTKQFGTARVSMELDATRHRQRYPGHRMDLRETRVIHRMADPQPAKLFQESSAETLDEIPF